MWGIAKAAKEDVLNVEKSKYSINVSAIKVLKKVFVAMFIQYFPRPFYVRWIFGVQIILHSFFVR